MPSPLPLGDTPGGGGADALPLIPAPLFVVAAGTVATGAAAATKAAVPSSCVCGAMITLWMAQAPSPLP